MVQWVNSLAMDPYGKSEYSTIIMISPNIIHGKGIGIINGNTIYVKVIFTWDIVSSNGLLVHVGLKHGWLETVYTLNFAILLLHAVCIQQNTGIDAWVSEQQ